MVYVHESVALETMKEEEMKEHQPAEEDELDE